MCGRYQLDYEIDDLMMRFNATNNFSEYGTRAEIFPTEAVAIILRKEEQNTIEAAKWGLENYYDKRPLINARGETLDEKKTFKNLFLESRCIIPATGFFEWKTENKKKAKLQIRPKGLDIFGMAGLYKVIKDENGDEVIHFVVVTAAANKEMSEIHHRMPVILTKENEDIWMDSSIKDSSLLKEFIKSYTGPLSITPVDQSAKQLSFSLV